MESTPLISLSHVSAGYDGHTVVSDINLDIYGNDVMAFIGPNGGGKTTILKLILGTLQPTEGTITRQNGLRIGYLPQQNNVDLTFPISILDTVLSGQTTGNRLFPSKETIEQANELLRFADLDGLQKRQIGELSGGQRQRVFLCRALMSQPDILVLDEPVTYMDKNAETNLYKMMPELAKKMAIVFVSHDVGTIASYVKTIACINKTLHYHRTNTISEEMLRVYECPVEVLTHGVVPHRVLASHRLTINRTDNK